MIYLSLGRYVQLTLPMLSSQHKPQQGMWQSNTIVLVFTLLHLWVYVVIPHCQVLALLHVNALWVVALFKPFARTSHMHSWQPLCVFKPSNVLRQSPVHVKKRLAKEKKRSVLYQVICKGCDQVYIGETKRNLKIWLAEHRQAVRRGDDKNGITVQIQKCDHSIDWEDVWAELVILNYWKSRTAEAILIWQWSPTMNLDRELHHPWQQSTSFTARTVLSCLIPFTQLRTITFSTHLPSWRH